MKAPIPENEENLIYEYIYRDYLIEILEQDLNLIPDLGLKIYEPYEFFLERILNNIRLERKELREKMRSLGIKVLPARKLDMFIEYPYLAHGYEGVMKFWDKAMELEGKRRLIHYFIKRKNTT